MSNLQQLSGPDFLDAVADSEAANGNQINSDAYRQRATQWRADQVELYLTRNRCQDVEDQLAAIHNASSSANKSGAITPTDQRH